MSEDFFLDPSRVATSSSPRAARRTGRGSRPARRLRRPRCRPVTVSNITTGDDRHQLRRRQGRRARAREGVVLPELAGCRARRDRSGWRRTSWSSSRRARTSRCTTAARRSTSIAMFLTLLGIAGVVWLARSPAARLPGARRSRRSRSTRRTLGRSSGTRWEEWNGSDGWEPDTPAEEEWSYEPRSAAGPAEPSFGRDASWVDDETAPWRASGMRDPRNR